MEAGALRPGLVRFPACLEGENQAGTGARNHSQLYPLWLPRRKEEERAGGPSPGDLGGDRCPRKLGTKPFPSVRPVQPQPQAVPLFSATRDDFHGRENRGVWMWGQVAYECWSWLYKLCDIKQAHNLSEPQCLPLQQSRSASACPVVVLVSRESMPRCV